MKTKKLVRYAVACSTRFPSTHCRKGEPTYFVQQIKNGIYDGLYVLTPEGVMVTEKKLHTIRNNKNNVWTKRMEKVNRGEAVIDLFYWKLPGGRWTKDNEQIVFATLDKDSGCGVQPLIFTEKYIYNPTVCGEHYPKPTWYKGLNLADLAKNDGLTLNEFKSWFKGYNLSEPLAIIHFTKFRY